MHHERYWNASAKLSSEKTRIHALQLYITRSIARRYGGRVETDPMAKTINVTIPGSDGAVCAREIKRQLGALSDRISTHVDALSSGEILIQIRYN